MPLYWKRDSSFFFGFDSSCNQVSPVPCMTARACSGARSANGVSSEKPACLAIASANGSHGLPFASSGHAAMAPVRIESDGLPMSRFAFAPRWTPRPSQVGHQPSGPLKE